MAVVFEVAIGFSRIAIAPTSHSQPSQPSHSCGSNRFVCDCAAWRAAEMLQYWDRLPLEPYASNNDTHFLAIYPTRDPTNLQASGFVSTKQLLKEISSVYSVNGLGRHMPWPSRAGEGRPAQLLHQPDGASGVDLVLGPSCTQWLGQGQPCTDTVACTLGLSL